MMKKSRWIWLLLALICLSLLFVSCSSDEEAASGPDGSDEQAGEGGDGNADGGEASKDWEPVDESVMYRTITDEWSKYLAYRAPERTPAKTASLLIADDGDTDLTQNGVFLTELTRIEDPSAAGGISYSACVYSVVSGTAVTPVYTYGEGEADRYSFEYTDSVVEVAVTDAQTGLRSYDYYTANGERVNESPLSESVLDVKYHDPYSYVYVGDTCYISRNGEILRVSARGEEKTPILFDKTFGGFGYVIGEEIRIYGEGDRPLVSYWLSDAYDSSEIRILGNGNVLVAYRRAVAPTEKEYTVELADGSRELHSYVMIHAATGAVSELHPDFVIDRMITREDDGGSNLTLKGDYQYAEICKLVDGKRAATVTPVILDDNLRIIAELPVILKNQDSLVRAASESFWVVSLSFGETEYFYSVDLSTGRVSLYANLDEASYTRVENGFLYGDALYNDLMGEKMDLTGATVTVSADGRLLVTTSETEGAAASKRLVYLEEGQVKTATLGDANDEISLWENGLYYVDVRDGDGVSGMPVLYNEDGTALFAGYGADTVATYGAAALMTANDGNGTVFYYSVR